MIDVFHSSPNHINNPKCWLCAPSFVQFSFSAYIVSICSCHSYSLAHSFPLSQTCCVHLFNLPSRTCWLKDRLEENISPSTHQHSHALSNLHQHKGQETQVPSRGTQNPTKHINLDLKNVAHVSTNVRSSQFGAMLYVFGDTEAVIKMIIKGRSPTMRHVSRTHKVALDWLFDRDTKIQIRYIDTKHQIADIDQKYFHT